jgi:hypothetical protein
MYQTERERGEGWFQWKKEEILLLARAGNVGLLGLLTSQISYFCDDGSRFLVARWSWRVREGIREHLSRVEWKHVLLIHVMFRRSNRCRGLIQVKYNNHNIRKSADFCTATCFGTNPTQTTRHVTLEHDPYWTECNNRSLHFNHPLKSCIFCVLTQCTCNSFIMFCIGESKVRPTTGHEGTEVNGSIALLFL